MENLVSRTESTAPNFDSDGFQPVAMLVMPNAFAGKSPKEQAWVQYKHERKMRHPVHTRQWPNGTRTTLSKIEPMPNEPILTPRKENYQTHADFIHALRDYSLKLNTLHKNAHDASMSKNWVSRGLDYVGWGNTAQVAGAGVELVLKVLSKSYAHFP